MQQSQDCEHSESKQPQEGDLNYVKVGAAACFAPLEFFQIFCEAHGVVLPWEGPADRKHLKIAAHDREFKAVDAKYYEGVVELIKFIDSLRKQKS